MIDPPWRYEVYSRDTGVGRSAESHYPTMTREQLLAMQIKDLAADNCCLFMWCTWPTIEQAFELGNAWGFKYKTAAFEWAKMNKNALKRKDPCNHNANWFFGMGHWTRANTEPCLLFTIGNPKRVSKAVRQLIVAPVRRHSQKPDEQYERIEQLVTGPYLEIFARAERPGWDCFGNEVKSTVEIEIQGE